MKLVGAFEVVRGDVAIPVRGAKQRALLALLALNRGNPVSADCLIDQLWGDGQTAKPANALQAQIVQLRRTLGASAIVTSESGYALDINAADLDAARFEDLVAEGRRLSTGGEVARASAVLGDALRLRRGEPLSEFAYAGFADAERAHLNELALVATEYRVEADLELGHHNELVGGLEALCRDHPLRERFWELLMLALYRAGRQAEALRAYTEIRDRLVDELGVDPGSSLRELETRVLDYDPSLVAEQPPLPRAPTLPSVSGNLAEELEIGVIVDRECNPYSLQEMEEAHHEANQGDAWSLCSIVAGPQSRSPMALPGPPSHWSYVVVTHAGHPRSQLMSCRTDRAIPTTASAPAQAIKVIAPTPGETR